jgi:hypothetical protein
MPGRPPADAEAAIIGAFSTLTSRVEIFEADGETRWKAGAFDRRLVDGSVSIDYSRDERRSFDIQLSNHDYGLIHEAGEFWYDKVLKIYSGVEYDTFDEIDSTIVNTNLAVNPKAGVDASNYSFAGAGGTTSSAGRIVSAGSEAGDTAYEVIWSTKPTSSTATGVYYYQPNDGSISPGQVYSFRIFGRTNTATTMRLLVSFYDAGGNQINQAAYDTKDVLANRWYSFSAKAVTSPAGAARVQIGLYVAPGGATIYDGYRAAITGVTIELGQGSGKYYDGSTQPFGNRVYAWSGAVDQSTSTETISITSTVPVRKVWDTQVGEFLIDRISEPHFPAVVSVTGRDYTKKCLLSKYVVTTSYASGTAIETAIKAIAQGAGVSKFILPTTGHALGKEYVFERGTSRWEAMKQIADAFGYDLFFDANGYLVLSEQKDPVLAPLIYEVKTGPGGILATYDKSLNDTRIYNHIIVTGETSDTNVLPVSAEAINTEPSSPTRVNVLGDRVYQYTSAFITTTVQAQDVADKFLAVHALEEYDLNFEAISLPWLDVGEIIRFIDPRPAPGSPDRFLLSSLTIPLKLGTMSGNGKRVTVVG